MAFRARNANFNALRNLSLSDRLNAVSDPSMGQTLISMLSPTQAAELFPNYWIERNPNISGFLKAIPSSLSAAKQKSYEEQIQNTASGSSAGANYEAGGYRKKWQKEMDAERERSQVTRRFEAPLPQLSPEQRQAFEALKAGDIGVDDDRVKFLKNISDADLTRAGLTRIKDDKGSRYHYQAPQVSDEDVKRNMASGGSLKQMIDRAAAKEGIDPRLMYGIVAGESSHKSTYDKNENLKTRDLSYGPFQMNILEAGMEGDRFQKSTGLSVKDPSSLQAQAYWVARKIKQLGSDPNRVHNIWHGYKGNVDWNPSWGSMGAGQASEDPITQNYSPQQLEIKKRELLSDIEAGRINSLAQITQPGMRAAAQELNINSTGDMKQVKAQYDASSGWYHSTAAGTGGSNSHRECADLSKAFNPNIGTAGTWKIERNDAGIRPGVAVATQMYNSGTGGAHHAGYHTGIALTSPDGSGNFLILEQANGMRPRVHQMNVNEYGYSDKRIPGNFWGPIKGHEHEQSLEALKIAYQLASDDQKARIQSSLGGVSDQNVVTSNSNRVETVVGGYDNPQQMAQSAGVGLSEKAQVERKDVVQGSLSFEGGGTYHFGSGRPDDPNFPSTPLGSSEVGGLNPHHVPGGVGYEMPALNNKLDPKVGRTRNGMVIHSSGHDDLERLYSHGCISIPKSEFPAFQQEMENFKKTHGGKAYINIMPDGRVTVTATPAYSSDGTPLTPMSTDQAVKEIQTNQPQVVQSATQVASGDIKPLTSVTQPTGPVNAAGPVASEPQTTAPTAAPQPAPEPQTTAPTAAVEAPKPPAQPAAPAPERYNVNVDKFTSAIRQTEDFKRQAGMFGSMVPNSTIINGFNDDPRVKAAGVHLDEKGVMHFTKGMTPDVKEVMSTFDTKSFMTKIEDKKKEDAPTKVKAMAEGGTVPVNTEQITAYPIGGLRGDNAVVVNAHQKPLFTMNTNEDVLMDPNNNRAQVLPNEKSTGISPMPKDNMTSGLLEEFNSTIKEMRQSFASLKPSEIVKTEPSFKEPVIENGWLGRLNQTAADPFKTPSVRRVAYRAGGMETGDPSTNFHYSRGNNS